MFQIFIYSGRNILMLKCNLMHENVIRNWDVATTLLILKLIRHLGIEQIDRVCNNCLKFQNLRCFETEFQAYFNAINTQMYK